MARFIALVLLVSACSPSPPEANAPDPTGVQHAAPPPQPSTILPAGATAVPDLASVGGEWRVAGVGGPALSQPYGISASIQDGRVRFVSQCVTRLYSVRIEAGHATSSLLPNEVPDCARALTIDERGLEQAMAQVTSAYRMPSNALVFDGPAGAVTLFTQ